MCFKPMSFLICNGVTSDVLFYLVSVFHSLCWHVEVAQSEGWNTLGAIVPQLTSLFDFLMFSDESACFYFLLCYWEGDCTYMFSSLSHLWLRIFMKSFSCFLSFWLMHWDSSFRYFLTTCAGGKNHHVILFSWLREMHGYFCHVLLFMILDYVLYFSCAQKFTYTCQKKSFLIVS